MGHAEMLLAVAGLDQMQVSDRVQVLASGDWSSFEPRQRVALFLAKKMAKEPSSVTAEDRRQLIAHWGPESSLEIVWHISWCNFMTRVADAFQIPLEERNVFVRPPMPPSKP